MMEWKELEPSPRNHSSHTASLMGDGKLLIWGSIGSTWNMDMTILDTTRIPDLNFWTFEEAKKEAQMKLKIAKNLKSKEEIENKISELLRILSKQFDHLREEEDIISNNYQVLYERIENFEREKYKMKQYELDYSASGVVKLNVGGQIFHTTLKTLNSVEGSMLGAMFSGRYSLPKDENGCYFIDRDGTNFRYILNYLRDGHMNVPNNNVRLLKDLALEASYYGLEDLLQSLRDLVAGHGEGPRNSKILFVV
eukprot:TRINITY_DN5993_c0_g1_i18.p1 TRINITY_DN5993_c0_g1~~TRINITY_DN5993_c0_g1_i18.p1  ORF type:complete len:252 (-),score=58.92 TRINITY_DN5993_c0_g1_i18:363-1118(-)